MNVCSPKRAALLGLNVGAGIHVKLRLRRPNNDEEFYPYNEVLDTMLHELCHNAHGPHNASFYKLWDELRKVNCIILMVGSGVWLSTTFKIFIQFMANRVDVFLSIV